MAFWIEKGVDGFRVDAIRHMFEAADISQDEPRSMMPGTTPVALVFFLVLFSPTISSNDFLIFPSDFSVTLFKVSNNVCLYLFSAPSVSSSLSL
jgi:glycosidase